MELPKQIVKATIGLVCLCFWLQTSARSITHLDGLAIYSKDGTRISANVYMPIDSQQQWPLIIMPNSWNLDEYEYTFPAQTLAKKGYVVLSYSARGWGKSEGRIMVASTQDLQDIDAIITWALTELPVDSRHIGMAGISYGGGLSLLAATHDSRIKAVAIMSAWSDLESALYGNNTPSKLWGSLLVQSGKILGRLDPQVDQVYQNLLHHKNMDEVIAWARVRSPTTYIDNLNRSQTAVYLSQNLGDRLFKPNALLSFFEHLQAPKRMDINQGIHASAEASALFGFDNYVWNQAYRWFDHWLKGVDNGMDKPPYLSVEIEPGKRLFTNQWPLKSHERHYYLQQRANLFVPGKLRTSPPRKRSGNKLTLGLVTGVNSGVPIVSPILEAHKDVPIIAWLPAINPFSAIYYQSQHLSKGETILGIPRITLHYTPSLQKMQIVAYLYDVDLFGVGELISHAPLTRYHDDPGKPHVAEFAMSMAAHHVPEGHRIALAIGTYDVLYAPPTLIPYSEEINYGKGMASRLTIPFIDRS